MPGDDYEFTYNDGYICKRCGSVVRLVEQHDEHHKRLADTEHAANTAAPKTDPLFGRMG